MTNISRSTMELLLVTLVLTASMAVVVDAPLNRERDLGLPSGHALSTAEADSLPPTSAVHGGSTHLQRRHIQRLESSLARKSWLIDVRRNHAAAARYQVLRCEAARLPVEIRLADALGLRDQPVATLAESDARDKTIEELKQAVVAATKRLHRAQHVLKQVERSIARRTLRVLRMEAELDLAQRAVETLRAPGAGSPAIVRGPRRPA
jgi:hypothetical protein